MTLPRNSKKMEIDEEIARTRFACDLDRCRGACCTMPGHLGAPLWNEEVDIIHGLFPIVRRYLSDEHLATTEQHGLVQGVSGGYTTQVVRRGACVFVCYEEGVAKCAFEKAFRNGEIPWRKPLSCHLFPIRVTSGDPHRLRFEYLPICRPALERGGQEEVWLVDFVKDALIRLFSEQWYIQFVERIRREQQTVNSP